MPKWLREDYVIQSHRLLLQQFGGLSGDPSPELLESTLARPLRLAEYEPGTTVLRLAACYGWGLARNQCFPDGNKRVAWAAVRVFLRINGFALEAGDEDKVTTMWRLATGGMTEQAFADWLEEHRSAIPRQDDQSYSFAR